MSGTVIDQVIVVDAGAWRIPKDDTGLCLFDHNSIHFRLLYRTREGDCVIGGTFHCIAQGISLKFRGIKFAFEFADIAQPVYFRFVWTWHGILAACIE